MSARTIDRPPLLRTGFLLCSLLAIQGAAPLARAQLSPTMSDINRAIEAERQNQRFLEDEKRRHLDTEQGRFTNSAWIEDSAEKLRDLVFLPPLPPVLAQAEPDPTAPAYPVILSENAGETFFMAHGRLHFRGLLKPAQTRRIAAYRETRDRLTGELRQTLGAAENSSAADSARLLEELAVRQEPALHALEAEAESIRAELAGLDDGAAVISLREKLPPEQPAALRDYFSAVHAAHFQDGLSLDQRQLLLAIAARALHGAPQAEDPVDVFLPAPAHLRWPADPAGHLAPLLGEFRDRRERLEAELREQVLSPAPAGGRTKAHAALAAQQAPQFAGLHELAERIRIRAAALEDPARPAPTDFPPELVRTVGEAVAAKDAFQARTKHVLTGLGREFAPLRFKLVFRDKLPVLEAQPAAGQTIPETVPPRLQQANETLQRDYGELAARLETARLSLQGYRQSLGPSAPEAGKLSAQLARIHAQDETWRKFADYRTAVLTPGLSPAQRRLLLNATLRDLEKQRLRATD